MPKPKSAELKAKIAAAVAKREDLKKPVTALEISVWVSWMAYVMAAVQEAIKALDGPDGMRPTHLQIVPDVATNKVYFISAGPDDAGAEKVTRRSNGGGTVNVHAALDRFHLEHVKGHKMVFSVYSDPDTEYGPALVMPIGSLEYVKVKSHTEEEKPPGAGQQAAPTEQPKK